MRVQPPVGGRSRVTIRRYRRREYLPSAVFLNVTEPFMRVLHSIIFTGALLLMPASSIVAQSPLGETLKDIEVAPHWIYDDLPRAVSQAKSTGKPLLVVLRCVPCPPGRSLDAQVMQPDKDLEALEQHFVCVRLIQANSLDLDLFQYDYDMSWSAMFLAPDLTVYGRYGSRNATGLASDSLLSIHGFRKAAERALDLHKRYPAIKGQLAGKTGMRAEYRHPRQIPGLEDRPAVATTKQNCIHCHMVREYDLRAKWQEGTLTEAHLWVYPMPERVGLTLDVDDGLVVKEVASGSPAERAGLAPGDALVAMNRQPLISTADVQWVLHNSPNEVQLPVTFQRRGQLRETALHLSGEWKRSDISWRASSWYGLRQGVKLEPMTDADKEKRGLEHDRLALVVKGLFGRGGPRVKEAGLRVNDVVVAVDGQTEAMTESDFLAYLRLQHGPNDPVRFQILRGDRYQELVIPAW